MLQKRAIFSYLYQSLITLCAFIIHIVYITIKLSYFGSLLTDMCCICLKISLFRSCFIDDFSETLFRISRGKPRGASLCYWFNINFFVAHFLRFIECNLDLRLFERSFFETIILGENHLHDKPVNIIGLNGLPKG